MKYDRFSSPCRRGVRPYAEMNYFGNDKIRTTETKAFVVSMRNTLRRACKPRFD